jgi:hypothetical protein
MRFRPACRRRVVVVALAALVVVANLNCLVSAMRACEQMAAPLVISARRAATGLPGGCENESGCICRGATLVETQDGRFLAPTFSQWMTLGEVDSALVCLGTVAIAPADVGFAAPPPVSGRPLRALLASLVI